MNESCKGFHRFAIAKSHKLLILPISHVIIHISSVCCANHVWLAFSLWLDSWRWRWREKNITILLCYSMYTSLICFHVGSRISRGLVFARCTSGSLKPTTSAAVLWFKAADQPRTGREGRLDTLGPLGRLGAGALGKTWLRVSGWKLIGWRGGKLDLAFVFPMGELPWAVQGVQRGNHKVISEELTCFGMISVYLSSIGISRCMIIIPWRSPSCQRSIVLPWGALLGSRLTT